MKKCLCAENVCTAVRRLQFGGGLKKAGGRLKSWSLDFSASRDLFVFGFAFLGLFSARARCD